MLRDKKSIKYLPNAQLILVFLITVTLSTFILSTRVSAIPGGPVLISNSTDTGPSLSAISRTDARGTITTLKLDMNQQNYRWKAYIGNVSGKYALMDSSNYTIYDWTLSSNSGEVYATRYASSVSWSTVACANSTEITNEESTMNHTSSEADSIRNTFTYVVHQSFEVGSKPIAQNTCNSTATYLNSASQTINESTTKFQEVLLDDYANAFIYVTILDFNTSGYNNVYYDFQMLVAEDEGAANPTTYYFYVELL